MAAGGHGLDGQHLRPDRSAVGLTPAKAVNMKNADTLEFFEGVEGQTFCRLKASARKVHRGRDGEDRKGFARPQDPENIMLPVRMHLQQSSKKGPWSGLGRTPLGAAAPSRQAAGCSVPRPSQLAPLAPAPLRQSISERKAVVAKPTWDPSTAVSAGRLARRPPAPLTAGQARKGLLFPAPAPRASGLPRPAPRPPRAPVEELEPVTSPSMETFVSPNPDSFPPPRESLLGPRGSLFLDPRESLAWLQARPSTTFGELQKLMNENDKRNVNDDDTDSFEAMEKRMRTPVKEKGRGRVEPGVQDIELPQAEENKENISIHEEHRTEGLVEPAWDEDDMKPDEEEVEEEMDDIEMEAEEPVGEPARKEEKRPSLPWAASPLRPSQSLGSLGPTSPGAGAEGATLARAASQLQLGTGEQVQLSGLVPTDQVEALFVELDDQAVELERLRREQDGLAAATQAVLARVQARRQQFRELWGVSPLRINTRRTVFPPRAPRQADCLEQVEEEQVVVEEQQHQEVKEVDGEREGLEDSLEEDSDEETGIAPLAATPAGRRVRFHSGHNETHLLPTPAGGSLDTTPVAANGSNQSFAALKTSFAFLNTPVRGGTPHQARGLTRVAEPTPVALRKLGDRVRGELAALYAADSGEEETERGPGPLTLRF